MFCQYNLYGMDIDRKQIKYKKEIGHIGKDSVLEIGTIGGLYLIVRAKDGKVETLGVGPHRAVARHIAKKRNVDFEITELSKSEATDYNAFKHLLPEYESLTNKFNK